MLRKIHRVEDHFVISEGDCWRPGAFESEEVANLAFSLADESIQKMQDSVNPGGIITLKMIKEEIERKT